MKNPEGLHQAATEYYADYLAVDEVFAEHITSPQFIMTPEEFPDGVSVRSLRHGPLPDDFSTVTRSLADYINPFSRLYAENVVAQNGDRVNASFDNNPDFNRFQSKLVDPKILTGKVTHMVVQAVAPDDSPVRVDLPKRQWAEENRLDDYEAYFLITGRAWLGAYAGSVACMLRPEGFKYANPRAANVHTVNFYGGISKRIASRHTTAVEQYEASKLHAWMIEGINVRRPFRG